MWYWSTVMAVCATNLLFSISRKNIFRYVSGSMYRISGFYSFSFGQEVAYRHTAHKPTYGWMDGPPGRRMPAGRYEDTYNQGLYLKLCCRRQWQPHSLFPGLSTITWQRSSRSDLHALDAAYPYCTDIHHLSVPQSQ